MEADTERVAAESGRSSRKRKRNTPDGADPDGPNGAVQNQPRIKVRKAKAAPALPWLRLPVEIDRGTLVPLASVRGLGANLQDALLKAGYKELFPVQAAAWRELAGGQSTAHDLAICAPTGSGKTLAYALPTLRGLQGHSTDVLGALIVLPTRELAIQVFDVFVELSAGMGLRVGLAAAQASLAAEQAAFLEQPVQVLVATPGRLMAHLKAEAPVFDLHCLRFLVVDELDRLLRQSYQNWLPHVILATSHNADGATSPKAYRWRVIKIAVSATLTQDPTKLDRLQLHAPRFIAMSATDQRYKLPRQLREFKLVCAAVDKPIVLAALLHQLRPAPVLVFTGSVQSTRRLHLLLSKLPQLDSEVAEHSSAAVTGKSTQIAGGLARFRAGNARVLVSSDALTRGMDVAGVDTVVNYDAPVYPKTYIHRAGRTARAGCSGRAITMLRPEEVRHFKALLRKVDNTHVRDYVLPPDLVASLRPSYSAALAQAQLDFSSPA